MWVVQTSALSYDALEENAHLNVPSPSTSSQSSRQSFDSESSGSTTILTFPPSIPENTSGMTIPSAIAWGTGTFGSSCFEPAGSNFGEPYLVFREQPVEKFRFRYKSEMMGTHGSLLGRSSEKNRKKTYPTVELRNYNGLAKIRCSLYTTGSADSRRYLHCHRLVVKQGNEDKDDPHDITVGPDLGYIATFQGMGIIHTAKKNIVSELIKKKQYRLREQTRGRNVQLSQKDEMEIRIQAEEESKKINQNTVCLCFEALKENPVTGYLEHICPPIFSAPVNNMKSALTGELKICRMDKHVSSVIGGEEVFMLVEKVGKKNIKIKFYELDDEDTEVWYDYGRFSELDVHHQYAIVFRTPPYRDLKIDRTVDVFVQLYRPTDGDCSEPLKFQYKPQEKCALGTKRPRMEIEDIPVSVQNTEMLPVYQPIPEENEIDKLYKEIDMPVLDSTEYKDYIVTFSSGNLTDLIGEAYRNFHMDVQTDSESNVNTDSASHIPNSKGFDLRPRIPERKSTILVDQEELTLEPPTDNWIFLSGVEAESLSEDVVSTLYKLLKAKPDYDIFSQKVEEQFRKRLQDGEGPLHLAVKYKQINVTKSLIDALNYGRGNSRCYLNDRDNLKRTPLHYATVLNQPEYVETLLKGGSDPDKQDFEGNTPLHIAAELCDTKCLEYLLKQSIYPNPRLFPNINRKNNDGLTPLHLAIRRRLVDSVVWLLLAGADVNEPEPHSGNTPLHMAVQEDSYRIALCLLLQKGIEVDKPNFTGNTPLHYACVVNGHGSVQIIKLLLKNKADPYKTNYTKKQMIIKKHSENRTDNSDVCVENNHNGSPVTVFSERTKKFNVENSSHRENKSPSDMSIKELLVSLNSVCSSSKETENLQDAYSEEEDVEDFDDEENDTSIDVEQNAFDLAAGKEEILQLLNMYHNIKQECEAEEDVKEKPTDILVISDFTSESISALDTKTLMRLCSILDSRGSWKNLCELLGYESLISELEKSSNPSQKMFSHINERGSVRVTIKELRDLLEILTIMDAVAVIDETCVTLMEAIKHEKD